MTVAAIVGGIFAIAKAVPAVRDMVFMINTKIIQWEISKIKEEFTARQNKIDVLVASISRATTKEERRELSKILFSYTSGKWMSK